MNNRRLTINLITYNSSRYLVPLFDSLKNQTLSNWCLNILDNNSSDDTVAVIKKELAGLEDKYNLILENKNLGFAIGHNKLLERTSTNYFLILNDDTVLEKDCLAKLVGEFDQDKTLVAISPRLMKLFDHKLVDSLGLKVLRSRRVVELGVNSLFNDKSIGDSQVPKNNLLIVFGVSGTCVLFRKDIIDKLCYSKNEMFDSDYFMYKEDVDLAYRINQAGYKCATVLNAICYHARTGSGLQKRSDWLAIKNKQTQGKIVKYYSYKNHLATLYKNECWQNLALDWPWIKWYEFKKFIYFLIFDRSVLRGWCDLWKERKELKNKKEQIKKMRRIDWKEMRRRMSR